ncbi:hypothetical protein FBR4_2290 [Lactiplantibacillus plantarum]|nr:Hypothetical protein zj316_2005 [Lactiplantibacillus plantarum ZJ316]AGL64352.2 hypothetical protein LBP_cg1606 [Lactiplantibacillus plantarum subsp. plantarum P-8]ASL80128.1 hypothetical protein GBLP1_g1644 [Lactiplantibacillus plantarum]KZD94022.1 hypothetical protein FBR4_2290 [Lactiplantibacillus plantarum]KZT97414.1 hypothetical protein Nizo2257_1487 [Lactiplantibacillus plantarum]
MRSLKIISDAVNHRGITLSVKQTDKVVPTVDRGLEHLIGVLVNIKSLAWHWVSC